MSLKLFLSLTGLFFNVSFFQCFIPEKFKRLQSRVTSSGATVNTWMNFFLFIYLFFFLFLFYFCVFIYFFLSLLCLFVLLVCFVAVHFVFIFYWSILLLCAFKFVFFFLFTRRFHFVVSGLRFNLPLVGK